MTACPVPCDSKWIARLAVALVAALMALAAPALAQVPGEYPHLTLSDRVSPPVPGAAGPWDNSHTFTAFSGMSFDAAISYEAQGQLNSNVFWGLLVSVNATAFPQTQIPPKLLTMPPFILILAPNPKLNVQGDAQLTLFVPPGLFAVDAYIQGLVSDSTHVPKVQLSNGLTLDIDVPGLNVNFAFVRNQETGSEGQLADTGVIDIDGSRLKTLKPLGPNPPPAPVEVEPPPPGTTIAIDNPIGNAYTLLPILANVPDEPVNPLARPMTTIVGAVTSAQTTIPVADTSGFPTRGRLLIALASNPFANKSGNLPPNLEVVTYSGKSATSFLNCERGVIGTKNSDTNYPHSNGQLVFGDFTMATTIGARERLRVSLDADNPDLPHVVLPTFTVEGGDGGVEALSLDLYRYERATNLEQGFMVFDRGQAEWRAIPGTAKVPDFEGTWDPMICVAPDHRSFVAVLRASELLGTCAWDNAPDRIFVIRLDGQSWPATGTAIWEITYPLTANPGPPFCFDFDVPNRRPIPRAFAIVGPDPENYVLYAGMAHKFVQAQPSPGSGANIDAGTGVEFGFEAEYVREEVLVRELIECALADPAAGKTPPSMPRPFISPQFGSTATGKLVGRFDPELLPSPDHTQLFLVGGRKTTEEEAFVIRNLSVTVGGTVQKLLLNLSGSSVDKEIRALNKGGHGQGSKAAFSPDGTRVAYVARNFINTNNQRRDWLNVALTNGGSFGQVKNVYENTATGEFKEPGALVADRVISGLRFIDNNRIVLAMGRNPYDDPLGLVGAPAPVPAMDLFVYNLATNVLTNVTRTEGSSTGFTNLGQITPAGFFGAPGGGYTYMIRAGAIGTPTSSGLPDGTQVRNILGLNHGSLGVFPVTGTELGEAPVSNLELPAGELFAPVEGASAMRFAAGQDVQEGMLYFAAHRLGGNGSDEVIALNRDAPFISLEVTATTGAGQHVRNLVADPYSGKVAFSRSGTSAVQAANEHPFVVDLDNFLFERDILPTWTAGGNIVGRVMDGSFHFIAPSGGADEALVFAFGLAVTPNGGVAQFAPPAYYGLATVSDPFAEPIPVVIPLIDTALLGGDFRFYVVDAGPSKSD